MSFVYIFEQGTKINFKENQIHVKTPDDMTRSLPVETLEGIILFGKIEVSTGVVTQLLELGIPMTWLSNKGKFFGRLESTSHVNIGRQRLQFKCGENAEFVLGLSKQLIVGKITNQKVFLRRSNRNHENREVELLANQMGQYTEKVQKAQAIEVLMGFEGIAAKIYFQGLSKLMTRGFEFSGRSKRPPRDPFNSLLSFGYTLLLYDVYTVINQLGLNPYAGFLHQDRQKHPTLASDLMEEWRSVLVDSVVVSMINKRMINVEDFEMAENGAVYADIECSKLFVSQYAKKVQTSTRYIQELTCPITFRRGIEHQLRKLITAMEQGDPLIYQPMLLR